jgi:glyoxylase-like metal-dependent hydrolase (beta-lactamase superfamily II)
VSPAIPYTHSDHIGNIDQLDHSTPLLVSPEELTPSSRGGRLLAKLPQGGRVQTATMTEPHEVFGRVMPLTERKDVFVISTPGHTVGHQSVVIDLGDRQVIIAGDAAFDDQQVQSKAIPGIVENRQLTLQTYEVLLCAQQMKPTLNLFTHDPTNRNKLAEFSRSLQ